MEIKQEENKFMEKIQENWVGIGIVAATIAGIGISTAIIGAAPSRDKPQVTETIKYAVIEKRDAAIAERDLAIAERDSLEGILAAGCGNADPETDLSVRATQYKDCFAQYQTRTKDVAKCKRERDAAIAKNGEYAATIANYENNPNVKVVYEKDPSAGDLELVKKSLKESNEQYFACQKGLKDAQQKGDALSNYNVGMEKEKKDRHDAIVDLLGPAVFYALVYERNIPKFCYLMQTYFIPAKGINTPEQWTKLRSYQKDSPNYYDVYNMKCLSQENPWNTSEK
ncbi:hypothetical protein HZA99_03135 [Candidatus Woesearchaeota archaeon]|nr:hypothetical protein [Candidatus Woesearchaeota archaeon]